MFSDFPNELKLSFFSFLNKPDLVNIMATCKHNKIIAADGSIWRQLTSRDFYCQVPDGIEPLDYYKTLAIEHDRLINCLLAFTIAELLHPNQLDEEAAQQSLYLNPETHKDIVKQFLDAKIISLEKVLKIKEMFASAINYYLSLNEKSIEDAVLNAKTAIPTLVKVKKLADRTDPSEYKGKYSKDKKIYDFFTVNMLLGLCFSGGKHLLEMMLDKQPSLINFENQNHSILHIAIASANPEMVELILRRGATAKINKYDSNGNSLPLTEALLLFVPSPGRDECSAKIVKLLLQQGADPDLHDCEIMNTARNFCRENYSIASKESPFLQAMYDTVINWKAENVSELAQSPRLRM